ncbi:hypothetical protein CN354_26440 [Bacillus cereus]|nr:hypothetical protein CN354_26440 [Bacillus cereus]
MKAIAIERYGGTEELKEQRIAIPTPQEDEVLIEVHATSVNPVDWKTRKGDLQEKLPFSFPIILGLDVSSIVDFSKDSIRKANLLSENGHTRGKIVICMKGKERTGNFLSFLVEMKKVEKTFIDESFTL